MDSCSISICTVNAHVSQNNHPWHFHGQNILIGWVLQGVLSAGFISVMSLTAKFYHSLVSDLHPPGALRTHQIQTICSCLPLLFTRSTSALQPAPVTEQTLSTKFPSMKWHTIRFPKTLLFVQLQSNKAFLTFVKLQDFFQTKQPHSFCCPGRLKWNHFCYSDQAEALQILYSVRAESTAIFSLPIGLKPCLKIHSVTKNNVSGIWICPASQIKTLDLWQEALDGNSSALCSCHSGYLVASDGNYLQQKASVQFCMPCGVALLTLSFQTAERGNSTHTALWHKEEKSTGAKRVCSVSGFLQRWKRF